MNSSTEEIKEILPKTPRDIRKDLPEKHNTFTEAAILSKDSRNQYFVRFPKKVAEALGFATVKKVEFEVTLHLPEANPEVAELKIKLMREQKK